VTIVSDTPDVEQVLFGEGGVAEGLSEGKVVLDMSTISPAASIEFAKKLKKNGVVMLDAPVSGGQKGATDGTLSIMVGGSDEAFERCLPLLQAMGKTIIHVGGNGSGLATKMVNQVAGSMALLAMAEAMRIVAHSGVDTEKVLQALRGGAARSGMLEAYPERVLSGDFSPGFKIRLMNKDLRLASEFAQSLSLELPVFSRVRSLYREAEDNGMGELGVQGIYCYEEERL
jgi:3-hydroxyisobutyrate dehydrogenase-like beta-hydroxyacid dehydrogenase